MRIGLDFGGKIKYLSGVSLARRERFRIGMVELLLLLLCCWVFWGTGGGVAQMANYILMRKQKKPPFGF